MQRKRKTICLDFDGVIHQQLPPWRGREHVSGGLIPGAIDAIEQLKRKYTVVVYSGRCCTESGIAAIQAWLKQHDIRVDAVCSHKPYADVFVDDKGVTYSGDWMQTIIDIKLMIGS